MIKNLGLTQADVVKIIKKELNLGPRTATVTAVAGRRARLLLAGESAPTEKFYKCVSGYNPAVGDRAYIDRSSGTYVVLGKI